MELEEREEQQLVEELKRYEEYKRYLGLIVVGLLSVVGAVFAGVEHVLRK